jgi:signal peptidase II
MTRLRIPASRVVLFVLLTVAALTVDLFSKSIVFNDLGYPGADPNPTAAGKHERFGFPTTREGESVPYIHFDGWIQFRLLTSFNKGALWGLGQDYTWLFAGLSMAAVIGIPVWLFGFSAARSLWLTIALALILGGTLGNLYDRIGLHGCRDSQGAPLPAVRDFLLFTFGTFHWPVFNFADVFLVTGASMLVVHSLLPIGATTPAESLASDSPERQNATESAIKPGAIATSLPSPPPAR